MELVLIRVDCNEWEYIWNWLAQHPLNEGLPEPSIATHKGESWQYMGSFKQNERVIHTFRHRQHPKTNRVENLNVQASTGMDLTQIEKKYRL